LKAVPVHSANCVKNVCNACFYSEDETAVRIYQTALCQSYKFEIGVLRKGVISRFCARKIAFCYFPSIAHMKEEPGKAQG
jgi:hypothetical protein